MLYDCEISSKRLLEELVGKGHEIVSTRYNFHQRILRSWPAFLSALAISGALMYAGWFNATCQGLLIAFSALYFGYALRGRLTENLRAKYPNATYLWLVSIGLTSAAIGVVTRLLMPSLQGSYTDYIWIAISFSTILAFVVMNRRDRDVVK